MNPATLEPVGSVPVSPPEEVFEAVTEARLAAERWAQSSFGERRVLLARVAEGLLGMAEEIAATVTAETGKPLTESYTAELFVSLDNLLWAASNAARVLRSERLRFRQLHLRHKRGWLLYEPLGVVAVISPWNFPLGIPLSQAVFAVAAGNAVVVKPSELTPLSGAWVERVFRDAGAPEGLVRVVQGGSETGAALVRAPGVAKVLFTGSGEVGKLVAGAAGERLRPVTLELGGKDPMLVFDDAQLDRAVAGALWGSFSNCGQVCSAVERIYVAQPLQEAFVEELVRRSRGLRLGRGEDLETQLGPLVAERRRAHIEELVDDALRRGAELRSGGRRPQLDLPGWFYEPTVLTGVEREARIQQEEIFGPVVTVGAFRDEDEAVRLANGSSYGLGASVWTSDLERAARVARRLEAGSVWTNDVSYSYGTGQASWGGTKESGFGRTHSRHGLFELSRVKFADLDRGRMPVPWWYPYEAGVLDRAQRHARRPVRRGSRGEDSVGLAPPSRAAQARPAIPFIVVSELSHVDETGEVRMVDVGGKPVSRRRAVATASVRIAPETASRLSQLPKGDALAAARLAGIMAAKRTSELIPLCHPLPLTHVAVEIEVGDGVEIVASAETNAQTGVEMEALVAASVAALTIYDMAKAIDSSMEVVGVRLLEKTKESPE